MSVALENARLSEEIQIELSQQIQAKEREEHRRVILEKVITTGQHVTEVHDVRTTLMRIWHGVHHDLGFDRLGLYLFNPDRNSMDGTFGTNNQGEMIDEWHTWVSLENDTQEARSFLRVIEKPDTILLTHTYESDNAVPEGHIMAGVQDFAAIVANVHFIISVHGSGLSNLCFASAGTVVIDILAPWHQDSYYWMISNIRDARSIGFCSEGMHPADDLDLVQYKVDADMTVNLADLEKLLSRELTALA